MSKRDNNFTYKDGVSLKEYFDEKFKENDRALDLAQKELSIRLEHLNEFRDAMKDQTSQCITRLEYGAQHELLRTEFVNGLKLLDTKFDMMQKLVYVGVGILLVIEVTLRFIK
jgi:hypothetical protein